MARGHLIVVACILTFYGCTKEYSCEDCILKGPPTVETIKITGITYNAASFHGELLKTGGLLVTDFGFCWATHPVPTILDNKRSKGQTDSLQNYQSIETGLSPDQTYFVRAYAINDLDTVYGRELNFKTSTNNLNDCLVAYFPFTGNTNDESGNNNHGVATGGSLTSNRNNIPNKAFLFDGDDYLKVLNSLSLSSIGNSITIAAWINNQDPGSYIVCKSAYNGPDMQFRLYTDAGGIHVANYRKATDFSNTLTPVNTWKYIAVISDGTMVRYYLNGNLISTSALHNDASVANQGTDLYIGADTHNVTEFFRGKLDEVRIYCRALSGAEVLQLYAL